MTIKIALVGNPNAGKTTLFNELTGSNQYVGNWPGVTVEKKEGLLKDFEQGVIEQVIVTDLPGIYSLSPYTSEEIISREYLINERPNVILNIIDGTNLERNLYLTTQLKELGIPVVLAVNMIDVVERHGEKINIEELQKLIKCPAVEISAMKGIGCLDAAYLAIEAAILSIEESKTSTKSKIAHRFSGCVEHTLAHIEEAVLHDMNDNLQRWYSVKLFERDPKAIISLKKMNLLTNEQLSHIEEDIKACEEELDDDSESIIISERYNFIESIIKDCYTKKARKKISNSDKIDSIVTNRYLALPIFAIVMFLVYYVSMILVGRSCTQWVNEGLFGNGFMFFNKWIPGIPVLIEKALIASNCAAWLKGLILNGIVAGVGSVLGFAPQMFALFLFLAFLESCGYMSRIAFILDKLFRKFGLSGKSFIPMLVGMGCSVPGIMASRTIENENDRRMTIITTSFIPCGAKVPLISMIAGAVFSGSAWIATLAYFIGIFAVLVSGIILKKTKIFTSEASPFVMELPSYHFPTPKNVLSSMWERGWSFIKKAGTIILLSTIVVWFASFFGFVNGEFRMLSENQMDFSILAKIGSLIAWIFRPLGFGTWQAAVSTITGLVGKENVVGTMGILFGGTNTYANISNAFTRVSGLSFLVFNLLCAPCFAAIGAISSEMKSTKWTFFAVAYQCSFAYLISLIITQFGNIFLGMSNIWGILFASLALIFLCYMIAKSPHKKELNNRKE